MGSYNVYHSKMIFGKYPISSVCQKRDEKSDRKDQGRNSDVWSDTRRDTDMGYQKEWRRYEKGLKERQKEGWKNVSRT